MEFNEIQNKKIVDEVVTNLTDFETNFSRILKERDLFMDMYLGEPFIRSATEHRTKDTEGLSRNADSITSESVETLAHATFSMLTSADPNFELNSATGFTSPSQLYKNTQLIKQQLQKIEYKRKLLKHLRSVYLNGTAFIYMPYMSFPSGDPDPAFESCDFQHLPLNQVFWSHHCAELEYSNFWGITDVITSSHLDSMAGADQEGLVWNKNEIERAKKESDKSESISNEMKLRLNRLGYSNFSKHWEFITRWGPLDAMGDGKDYIIGIVNRKFLVRLNPSPYPKGVFPIWPTRYIEMDNDPMGRGVGHQLKHPLKLINSNLNRTSDTITFGNLNMAFVGKYSGIDTKRLRPRPWLTMEVDNPQDYNPIKPDLQSAEMGLKLHEMLLERARNDTGATSTLQAVITEASASEVRIAQNNSMRKVANTSEIFAEPTVRKVVHFLNLNNFMFMDQPVWIRNTGAPRPTLMFPNDLIKNVDVTAKVVTDKDFTPQAIKNGLQLIQILSSVRNMVPGDVDIRPIVQDIVRRNGQDPDKIFPAQSELPLPPQNPGLPFQSSQGALAKSMGDRFSPPTQNQQFIGAQEGINAVG